ESGVGMIVSHHPLIFSGIKKLTGSSFVERLVTKAIKNDIALYAAHTNLDVIPGGVSYRMAEKLDLKNITSLVPMEGKLVKIIVFVPESVAGKVRNAMFDAGGGTIGDYDHCSFNSYGYGTFRAGEGTTPYTGIIGKDHQEKEVRIEMIVPDHLKTGVIQAMTDAHPYEEVAYDIYRLENRMPGAGMGVIGDLNKPMDEKTFIESLASVFDSAGLKHSNFTGKKISRVALCGGSGASLIRDALRSDADIFVTADVKYHSFFDADNKMVIADIGHYEGEKFSLEILYEIITKKFPKFAIRFSKVNTNPVNYFQVWQKQKQR
ncbi:MAG: Nif3-like dinuclear metal center hexameric protein, partial [Bacteroidales bacterium]|nr:Nif3-like dinuclear metal center hexameric protein [Bacteroidales bacterium]